MIINGNQHNRNMNKNCCTNSVPYGYGGRTADTNVLPVKIIMSPTCSNKYFVGKNRPISSATDQLTPPPRKPSETLSTLQAYGMGPSTARGNTGPDARSRAALASRTSGRVGGSGALRRVVCSRGCEGEEHARW